MKAIGQVFARLIALATVLLLTPVQIATATGGGDAPLTITGESAVFTSGSSAVAGATFVDADPAGKLSQYRGSLAWGDGSMTTGSFFSNPCGGFAFAGTHRYSHIGTYTVTISIRDLGGAGAFAKTNLAPAPTWAGTGNLVAGRFAHTATLLPNGTVLVAGGSDPFTGPMRSSELFQPRCGGWSKTGDLASPRQAHSATLLQNGNVLVVGGDAGPPNGACCHPALGSAELYNPATGAWSPTGSLSVAREYHTATLLTNGKVLLAGGGAQTGLPTDDYTVAELYDPSTGTWSRTGRISGDRRNAKAILLANGKVLLTGGEGNQQCQCPAPVLTTAELYDPGTGSWSATGSMQTGREAFTETVLPSGKVLVAGGQTDSTCGLCGATAAAEVYDPSTGGWNATGSMTTPRVIHTATLVSGKVLVAGGADTAFNTQASAELYDPAAGNWTATASMSSARWFHTATAIGGRVLVAGGAGGPGPGTAELYLP